MNPIVRTRLLFIKSARVILDDALFLNLIKKNKFSYISCISHNKLYVPSNVSIKQKKTININLASRTIDEVLSSFNDTSRNEIRKTLKMKEYTVLKDDNDFDEVYKIYKQFRKDKGLPIKKPYFLKSASIIRAYYMNELVSVITVYDVYPYLRIQNIFSKDPVDNKELRKHIGYATRRLIYEICKFGCEKKYKLLDLASVNLTDPSKKGITLFKKSFGGEVVDEYTYTYKSKLFMRLGK